MYGARRYARSEGNDGAKAGETRTRKEYKKTKSKTKEADGNEEYEEDEKA